MQWTRSETLALATPSCSSCRGMGLQGGRNNDEPCNCVLRAIFRACYDRFRYSSNKEKSMSRVSLEPNLTRERKSVWGRKDEVYVADFCLVSRRALTDLEQKIFRFHFLLGADWRLCCRRLDMDRGSFFHAVYRIEQKLGRIYRELQPYALYPINEYFHGTTTDARPKSIADNRVIPIRPPVTQRTLDNETDTPLRKVA